MKKIILFIVWFISFMFILNWSTSMISAPNTVENLAGIAILIVYSTISYLTNFFTNISIKRK